MPASSDTKVSEQQALNRLNAKRAKVKPTLHGQFNKKGNEEFSEYQDRYRWFTFHGYFGRMKSPNDQTPKSKDKMDLSTSYDRNYVEHPIKLIPKPKPKKYRPPDGRMNTKSDYQDTFIKKAPLPSNPYVPRIRFRIPPRRTDIVSEYQRTFVPLETDRPKAMKMKEGLEIARDKFNEVSTVQHDYREHKNFKRVLPVYQMGRGIGLGGPFTNATTYRECYIPKDSRPRPPKRPKPVHKDGPHFTDAISAGDTTRPTAMPDYVPAQLDPNPPFNGESIQMSDYTKCLSKAPCKPYWVTQLQVKPPKGDMILDSTYESDFKDPEVVPRVPPIISLGGRKRGPNEAQVTLDDQLPESTHRTYFTGQSAEAAKPFYPRSDNWQASTCGKIYPCTTYQQSYLGESHRERAVRLENMKKSLEQPA